MERMRKMFITLVTFFLLAAPELKAGQKESFVWIAESGKKKAQVLSSIDMNKNGQTSILLFDFMDDARFLIRIIADAKSGTIRYRLEDDSSEWWLENAMNFDESFKTMKELTSYSPGPGEGRVTHSLRAGGFELVRTYDYQMPLGREITEDFMLLASADEQALLFAENIPRHLREAILFFYQVEDQDATWRYDEFIGIIGRWLLRSEVEPESMMMEWKLEKRTHEWGLGTMTTPEELEFTSRFKSIDNADPLAGWRPEDLFPEK